MKYKLIKEYPRSPKLGTILTKMSYNRNEVYAGSGNFFTMEDIKKFPEFWEKVTDPVFRTLDGVDIYIGDKFYQAETDIVLKFAVERICDSHYTQKDVERYKFFHSKEKAHEHILYNRPMFSIKDIAEVYVTATQTCSKSFRPSGLSKQHEQLLITAKLKLKS